MTETTDDTDSTRSRIVQAAGVVLLVALVLPFVVTGAPAVVGAEESYVVLSGSMADEPEPVIRPGDVVLVERVDPAAVSTGDIITYERQGQMPTTHRVIDIQQQDGTYLFTTKGDNNEDADPQPVDAASLTGRVMFVIPYIGHVVDFADTTAGFALLVGVPVALLVLSEAWTLARDDGDQPGDASVATSTSDGEQTDDDPARSTITVRQYQLRWVVVALIPVGAGVGVLAYRLQTTIAITAFYATIGLFLLAVALYLRGRGTTDGANSGSADPDDDDLIVTGRPAGDLDAMDRIIIELDSLDSLRGMARGRNTNIVYDPVAEAYYLVGTNAVFRVDSEANASSVTPAETPSTTDETRVFTNRPGTVQAVFESPASDIATDGRGLESADIEAIANSADTPSDDRTADAGRSVTGGEGP